ncbi:MAG: enoyl-CoA hydratase/isomerase family protein [Candidatus Melainabacteria bacterium]|jgi:2-(1,2-epoxy-1,2-dihydrophenyl)acetyl-CoA isomerase|nr:enoyl-CoA hydratase/isomerase family protein [Candidatus Melainabacteria bacterium]MBX9672532.1 enoyl-CoA hydratase/isomerase family protein [Candidatus Obscuribacterales bacterium]
MSQINDKILLTEKKNGVGIITLNRPDKLNSFNDELSFQLQDALKEMEKDKEVKAIILTGSGRGFCAGQDLQSRSIAQEMGQKPSLGDSIRRRYNPIVTKLRRMEKPIIAAVNGVAAGAGASLAFACDFRIITDKVAFIQSFTKVGLIPDSGATFILPRLIGATKAFDLMLSADKLTAQEAFDLGVINKVVDEADLMTTATALAERLAQGPTKAFALTKRAINKAIFDDLEELLEYEATLQEIAGRSEDFEEGVKAFVEKRPPQYKGK